MYAGSLTRPIHDDGSLARPMYTEYLTRPMYTGSLTRPIHDDGYLARPTQTTPLHLPPFTANFLIRKYNWAIDFVWICDSETDPERFYSLLFKVFYPPHIQTFPIITSSNLFAPPAFLLAIPIHLHIPSSIHLSTIPIDPPLVLTNSLTLPLALLVAIHTIYTPWWPPILHTPPHSSSAVTLLTSNTTDLNFPFGTEQ